MSARAVEVLMPGVERDRKHGARLPLEADPAAGVVPDGRRSAAIERQDHLLVELALRGKLSSGRNFAHIAVVGRARCLMVDEYAGAPAPRPGLQSHGAKVGNIMSADDV